MGRAQGHKHATGVAGAAARRGAVPQPPVPMLAPELHGELDDAFRTRPRSELPDMRQVRAAVAQEAAGLVAAEALRCPEDGDYMAGGVAKTLDLLDEAIGEVERWLERGARLRASASGLDEVPLAFVQGAADDARAVQSGLNSAVSGVQDASVFLQRVTDGQAEQSLWRLRQLVEAAADQARAAMQTAAALDELAHVAILRHFQQAAV